MSASAGKVLIVDDKVNMLRLMQKILRDVADLRVAEGGQAALQRLACEAIDVVLCDLKMPDMDGLDVLRACKRTQPRCEFILMTAYASVGTAVEALRLGAYDYLTKPFEPDDVRAVVLKALGRACPANPQPWPRRDDRLQEVLPGLVAASRVMHDLADLVRRVAASDVTTLLLGETGTGKERIARALHHLGNRSDRRFIALNCAAIPADLLESELFGHTRGAFTGAAQDRPGLFEEAQGGTLFLDEIAEMRLSLQAKLTRALEERAVRRLGEAHERPVDVRLIAATHRNVAAMLQSGGFRQDLWYRLNVAAIEIPPLRERNGDIEVLVDHFLREIGATAQGRGMSGPITGVSEAAMTLLCAYDWPGNVRQLRAAMERAYVVCRTSKIEIDDLPPEIRNGSRAQAELPEIADLTWNEAVERGRMMAARGYLEAVLRRFHGQVADAAAHANVERESFYRLLRRYGIAAEEFRDGKRG